MEYHDERRNEAERPLDEPGLRMKKPRLWRTEASEVWIKDSTVWADGYLPHLRQFDDDSMTLCSI
jgi:hypothetical protein